MNKYIKYFIYLILAAAVVLQFFRGSEPEVRAENPLDIHNEITISAEVSGLLKAACYDCHSMETKYPWYTYVTPVSWFVFEHIEEGREELNFSEWSDYSKRRKLRKLQEIAEEVEKGAMPLESYTKMHGDADLTEQQKRILMNWAEEAADQMLD